MRLQACTWHVRPIAIEQTAVIAAMVVPGTQSWKGGKWKSKSSDVDSSNSESSNLKSSIAGENSQDESISHGDSGMIVNTGKIALSDGCSVGTDYACGNPEENSNSLELFTKSLRFEKPNINTSILFALLPFMPELFEIKL